MTALTAILSTCFTRLQFNLKCLALLLFMTATAYGATPVQVENAKPGNAAWQLSNPATNREIEGYASLTSVNRGEQISLFVNTGEPNYTIEIFRMGWYGGAGARLMMNNIVRIGTRQPIPQPDATGRIECLWTDPYVLTIPNNASDPTDWLSGVYLAKLTAGTSGKQSYIMFVVRDDARASDYLFQSGVTTFQAYNNWGGKSLYGWNSTGNVPAQKISFNRPYAVSPYAGAASGVGAGEFLTNVQPGPVDYGVSGAGWEYNMVRWLEREGYDVSYATNVDVHANSSLLSTHKAFLSVGHDEYWSWQMRQNVEAARDRGVSLGFFSANTCYWQIRFESSTATGAANRTIVAYKYTAPTQDPLALDGNQTNDYLITTRWRDSPVNRPEDALLGVMYEADPVEADLVIEDASHWVCANTGLRNGDSLPGLVGYEVDRMFGNAPAGTARIAHSPYVLGSNTNYSDMVAYTAASGATVFATGSIQWSWGLDDYNAPLLRSSRLSAAAQQMTRNVLARFVIPVPPPPPFVGFSDDFNDNVRDTTKWNFGALNEGSTAWDSTVPVREQNQRLEISPRANTSGLHYNGYVSAATWSMTNARAAVEVVQTTAGYADTSFAIVIDSNNWYRFVVESDTLYFQDKVAGVKSAVGLAYNAAQHRFWRFRHDSVTDAIVWETSADGAAWIARRTLTRRLALTALRIDLDAGTYLAVAAPGTAIFDNFRLESNAATPSNQPPVARPGGPYSATTGQAIQFNGSASSDPDGTIAAYQWTFGDGTTGTGATPTHAYQTAGTYTVTLTVTDNSGATNQSGTTATITVSTGTPAAPTSLNASSPRKGEVKLQWNDNSNNEQSFRIERSLASASGFTEIATVGANQKTYTDRAESRKTYYYRVRAANSSGNSAYSNTDNVKVK